jgi:hypothetical protein
MTTTEAFADTHPRVREAGKQALEDIGSVIRNPEVASLSSTLMAALSDARYYGALCSILLCITQQYYVLHAVHTHFVQYCSHSACFLTSSIVQLFLSLYQNYRLQRISLCRRKMQPLCT